MRVLVGKLSRLKWGVLFTAAVVGNPCAYASSVTSQVQASMDARNFEQVEVLSRSALNSPSLDPLDRAYLQQSLLIAYLQTDQHSKVVQLLDQLLLESPQDTALLSLRTKAYYLLGNSNKTLQSAQVELMVLKEKGAKPGEGLLRLHTQAARHLNDQKALLTGLKLWAQLYPSSESWSELIEASAQAGVFRVAGDLHLYRLMLATEGFGAPGEYLDAAEIFTRKGFYLEAQAVLDLAVRQGALPNAELGELYREKRKQVSLLVQQEGDEGAGTFNALLGDSGDAWLTEGYLQVLAGNHLAGVNTMEKGMAKGQFISPSMALLTFAEGLWFAGFRAEARLEFERLSADPQLAPVAELWALTLN